jgi:uncharacterized protein YaiL (DUF2058 family)
MGLRDQLLKAGLVSKKQAKKADAEVKRQDHEAKKSKVVAGQVATEKELELIAIEEEAAKKREHDLQLNMEREAERARKEAWYRCRQLLRSNVLNERRAVVPYYFAERERFVRTVYVTEYQKELLARGKLAIGRPEEDVDDFVIIPLYTAQTVQRLCPEMLVCLHSEVEDSVDLATLVD